MAEVKQGKDFNKQFDAEWYLKTYYENQTLDENMDYFLKYRLDNLHDFFKTGNIKGDRLLDVGTGPTIYTVISAANNVQEVFLSDYADANLDVLREWWTGKRNLVPNLFQYVISKENYDQTVQERESQLRQKVKGICYIDVTSGMPFGKDDSYGTFDLITSSTCIGSASKNLEEYYKCSENILSLLRPGGYIALFGNIDDDFYMVNNVKFTSATIGEEQLKKVYTDLGCDIVKFNTSPGSGGIQKISPNKGKVQFSILAKKQC